MRNKFIKIKQRLQLIKKLLRLNSITYIARTLKNVIKKINFYANNIICLAQLAMRKTLLH